MGNTPNRRVLVPWPAPGVSSFWEFDVFLCHWNAALKHILKTRSPKGEQVSIEACVYAWSDAGAAVLTRKKPLSAPEILDTPNWKALVQRLDVEVVKIASRPDPRGYGAAEWPGRLAYFLWPAVSGIRDESAQMFYVQSDLPVSGKMTCTRSTVP